MDRASLTNFDKRVSIAKAGLRPEQSAAQQRLKQSVPDAAADFDAMIGSPRWIHSRGGTLTGVNGEGRGVSPDAAKRFDNDPDKALKGFLQEHRALFRHGPEILDDATRKRDHTAPQGLRTVVWEQQVDGIPVFDSVLIANTTAKGELVSISSQFVPEPSRAADRGTPDRAAKARRPTITAEKALRAAAANVGEDAGELSVVDQPAAGNLKQRFLLKPLPGEATAQLVWLPLDGDTLRLCWQVELNRREFSERFRFVVDAETGEVLVRRKLTLEVNEAVYRVYTGDSPSPMSPGFNFPTNAQPPYVERQLLAISNVNATASPLGWLAAGTTDPRGNNVDAHLDRDADNRADLPRVQGALDANNRVVFDFPIDFNQNPTNYAAAAVTQLFYWCNWMHDKLYELGFTESAGNYQKDNFGRGGLDNDAILADAQDGSGVNNANFTPGPDGSPARIQMFLFSGPDPARDGDFDAEVILHEYAHGLTERLVGGGIGMWLLQSYGMGEGWSDFFAESLLSDFNDDLGANYPMGGYVTYQFNGLAQNYYYGIRRYPYSTNMNVNPLTLKDIDPNRASTHPGIPRNPIIVSQGNEVHRQGEVWCSMLWDMRANLLTKYAPANAEDYTNANMKILRYVTLALQLSPPNPNFVQARDAILLAARMTPDSGNDTNEIWAAFARRGLGKSAYCPDSSTTFGVIEAFDTPEQPEFDVLPHPTFPAIVGPVGGPFVPAFITNTLVSGSLAPVPWAATVAQPWLQLSQSNGVLAPRTSQENVLAVTSMAATLAPGLYNVQVFYTNVVRTQFIAKVYTIEVQGPPDDALSVSPSGPLAFRSLTNGSFEPAEQVYRVLNNTRVLLNWRAITTNSWLSVSPTAGTVPGIPEFSEVTVAVNPDVGLPDGNHYGAITFINLDTANQIHIPVSLHLGRLDYLVEEFATMPFEMAYSSLTFTPDSSESFYRICRDPASDFPTDPAGGIPLPLADDEYRQIALTNGQEVSLFGVSSNAVYIGANGNLTFDPGADPGYFRPGRDAFFSANRAAAFYGDLNPAAGGQVSYLQLSNRFVVTYEDVPEFGTNNTNNLQIELFSDGKVRFTWLNMEFSNIGFSSSIVGLSRGGGEPPNFFSSDFSASPTCTAPIALLLPARALEGDGTQHGTILLNAPLTNDLHVTLTSSDPDEVLVPEFIILTPVPGQVSYDFGIGVIDDGIPDGTQTATITASFPDRPSISAKMLVDDAEFAVLSLAVPPGGVEGNLLPGAGSVTASVVAEKPIVVHLQSGNPNRVRVPPSVVIPTGASWAPFDILLLDNSLLDGSERVIIEASVVNWFGDLDAIQVADNESRALQVALPVEILEGAGVVTNAGRVSLSGIALSNIVIALEADRPALVYVPPFVTNSIGQSNVQFSLVVSNNAVIDTFSSVRVMARSAGFIDATGSVQWIDDERPFVPSNPVPPDFESHVARDVTFGWSVNAHAPPTTLYNVYIGTNADLSTLSPVASTTDRSVRLPYQLDPGKTYYWQVIGRLEGLPSVESPVWQFTTATLGFTFDEIASPQFMGEPFPIKVTAVDEHGLTVTNYRGSLALTNAAPLKSKATIVISELDTVAFGRVEFANVSGRAINIAGWQISLYDWVNWPNPAVVYTVPGPSVALSNDLFSIRSLPLQLFPGRYPNFATGTNVAWNNNPVNNPIAVLLRDNVGTIVDFVCAGDADPAHISVPAAIPSAHWTSGPVRVNIDSSLTYQRIGSADLNASNDWTIAKWSVGTNNVGMTMPFTDKAAIAFGATPLDSFVNGVCDGTVAMLDEARGVSFGVSDGAGRGASSNPFDVLSRNDLALSGTAPEAVFVNHLINYEFAITNTGPSAASGVKLFNTLGPTAAFAWADASQGSCSLSNDVVICDLGSIAAGGIASVAINANTLARGVVTNSATIFRGETDAYLPNNTVTQTTTVSYPQLSILDITNAEPNSGSVLMTLTLRLSAPNTLHSSVAYATSDGTATAGADYQPATGVATFPPGETNATVSVPVYGDLLNEFNETVFVNLFSATNLDILRPFGVGTIADNDALPGMSVNDATVTESVFGTNAVFTVSLAVPSGRTVAVTYSTANGSAVAGLDYVDVYGSVVFPPGVTNRTITVPVLDDGISEPPKTFFLNLANSGNAILTRNQGIGTILDNDIAAIDHFSFEPVGGTRYMGTALPITVSARDGDGGIATDFDAPVRLLAFESPRSVSIGSSNTTWSLPFGSSFHDSRLQSIYTSNEIGSAGSIVGIAVNVATAPAQMLNNWTIRLRHTPRDYYPNSLWESSGWETNFQHNLTMVSNGWVTFPFTTAFEYNGREHLMVDFSFDNSSFSADGLAHASATPLPRSLYLRSDSGLGAPLDWADYAPTGTLASRVLNVRLIMARGIPLEPFALSRFVSGVSTEVVTLRAPATNVTLRVIDSAGHFGDSLPFTSIPLQIVSVVRNGPALTLRFPTLQGSSYVVERRAALHDEWLPVSPVLNGDGGIREFSDTTPNQQEFYRVRLVP